MIDPHLFAQMLAKRLLDKRDEHYARMAKGLPKKDYHRLCGRIDEIDELLEHIDQVKKLEQEDDDEDDKLTRIRKAK